MDVNLKIEYIPIREIKKYKNNAKIHTEKQINQIVESIKSFGFNDPIGIWKDEIVEGHGRYEAAKILKLDKVPIIRLDHLSDKDRKVYILAHNKLTMNTDFEMDNLLLEIEELKTLGADVFLTGFDAAEIDDLFSKVHDKEIKEDDFDVEEALKETPISRQGDVWLLGRHRLVCGDSTKAETYELLMEGNKANLVVTDLPYNVNYEGTAGKIQNDNMGDKEFFEFLLKAFKNMYENMADGAPIYVFHADRETVNFRTSFKESGFFCHQTCIWVKNAPVLGRSDYLYSHEPILYGWKPTVGHKWYADRKQKTVWNFDRPTKSPLHPTSKPVGLIAYPIQNSSLTNSIILEPFSGSASTLIACEQTDRICYAIEIEEKFVDIGVMRFIQQVGTDKDVFLIRDGEKLSYKEITKNEE